MTKATEIIYKKLLDKVGTYSNLRTLLTIMLNQCDRDLKNVEKNSQQLEKYLNQ